MAAPGASATRPHRSDDFDAERRCHGAHFGGLGAGRSGRARRPLADGGDGRPGAVRRWPSRRPLRPSAVSRQSRRPGLRSRPSSRRSRRVERTLRPRLLRTLRRPPGGAGGFVFGCLGIGRVANAGCASGSAGAAAAMASGRHPSHGCVWDASVARRQRAADAASARRRRRRASGGDAATVELCGRDRADAADGSQARHQRRRGWRRQSVVGKRGGGLGGVRGGGGDDGRGGERSGIAGQPVGGRSGVPTAMAASDGSASSGVSGWASSLARRRRWGLGAGCCGVSGQGRHVAGIGASEASADSSARPRVAARRQRWSRARPSRPTAGSDAVHHWSSATASGASHSSWVRARHRSGRPTGSRPRRSGAPSRRARSATASVTLAPRHGFTRAHRPGRHTAGSGARARATGGSRPHDRGVSATAYASAAASAARLHGGLHVDGGHGQVGAASPPAARRHQGVGRTGGATSNPCARKRVLEGAARPHVVFVRIGEAESGAG